MKRFIVWADAPTNESAQLIAAEWKKSMRGVVSVSTAGIQVIATVECDGAVAVPSLPKGMRDMSVHIRPE